MTTPYTTEATFDGLLQHADRPVIVDFTASWCPPCRAMAPVLDAVADERPDLQLVKVDVDRNAELAARHDVRGFPTFVVFDHGREIGRLVGARHKRAFLADIDRLLTTAPAL